MERVIDLYAVTQAHYVQVIIIDLSITPFTISRTRRFPWLEERLAIGPT